MIVTIREMDRDRRTCRAHDAKGSHRYLTYARDCEQSIARALCHEAEIDIAIDRGGIVRADLVVGAVRP